ncbi:MAG: carbohydrate ABC transporter permease [Bacillota bacterium]|nr:carbohydrate ABC transporter permease [Bacillota bacterium]
MKLLLKAISIGNDICKNLKETLKHNLRKLLTTFILLFIAVIFIFPLIFTITNSLMSEQEINSSYSMVNSADGSVRADLAGSYAKLKFIPDIATIRQYYNVLIKKLQFLIMFWNSVKITIPIVFGQVLVGSMAAYAFSKLKFPGRERLFFLYIIVMLMPFQVTLVPNYIISDKLGLINSFLSIIFPGVFSTFGIFLLRQFMVYIPNEYIEAAKVEGANHFIIFTKIVLPMTKAGIAALIILAFIDNWNMVEQPVIFLQDVNMHPLSVFLSSINSGERGIAFAASTVYMIPMLLIFLYGEKYLIEGIQLSGLKG